MSNRVGSDSAANCCETHDCKKLCGWKDEDSFGNAAIESCCSVAADILPNNREEVVAKECSIHILVL